MVRKFTVYFILLFTTVIYLQAQTGGAAINTAGTPADPSAMLDVSSSSHGVLIPRVSKSERLAIINPARALLVYQLDDTTGFWFYDGLKWLALNAGDNLGNHIATDSLNMNNNKIVNVAVCTHNHDAANKEYVDNAVNAGGGSVTLSDTMYLVSGSRILEVDYGGTTFTVPAGKFWSVESAIHNKPPCGSSNNSIIYNVSGTYSFIVPTCADYLCVEAWGGGGGGGGHGTGTAGAGGGGGGGAYAQGCFYVAPGSSHTLRVGGGGTGRSGTTTGSSGTSSYVGTLITANGGSGGSVGPGGTGGAGGTSTAYINIPGDNGGTGSSTSCSGGAGGRGGNGGAGGASTCSSGNNGTIPGGGGSGGNYNGSTYAGGSGARGEVRISWFSAPVRIKVINGNAVENAHIGNYNYTSNSNTHIPLPYILPEGTVVEFDVGGPSSSKGWISIKEYKRVVQ